MLGSELARTLTPDELLTIGVAGIYLVLWLFVWRKQGKK